MQFMNPDKLVNLTSLSGLYIGFANTVCSRTAPVFLVPDCWMHWLTSATSSKSSCAILPYQGLHRPGLARSARRGLLPGDGRLRQDVKRQLCARFALAPSNELDFEEKEAGERLYDMQPLFRAVAVAIRYSSFSVTATDISTIPVLIVRTGVEDGLSAPVHLEQVPASDRRAVVADSQGRLSAVEVTLEVAIAFLLALEKREEADGPITRDVIQGARVMYPPNIEAGDEERMGPLMGPSSTWVDAAKRPTWSGRGCKALKHHQDMCVQRRKKAEPIVRHMRDGESWWRYMRETSSRP